MRRYPRPCELFRCDLQHKTRRTRCQRPSAEAFGPLPSGKKQLRYYDNDGQRQTAGVFATRSEAWKHFREVIEPQLRGEPVALPDLTLADFAEVYLERHAAVVRGRTVKILRDRLRYATRVYGDVPLSELERMSGELAGWRAKLPAGSRFAIMAALRQTLGAAVDWGYMEENPAKKAGKNPQPPPRPVRPYTFPSWTRSPPSSPPSTSRCPTSPPPPGYGPRNGWRWSVATSTGPAA